MNIAVVALTPRGARLGARTAGFLRQAGHQTDLLAVPEAAREIAGAMPLAAPLSLAAGDLFSRYRGLVLIMALGIVVRVIAPHLKDKRTDPAVVVLDEGGSFAISVVSGHVGGANDLARLVAGGLGATPVITTATDVNGAPAVDVLARDLELEPDPPGAVKRINSALARGEKVEIYSEYVLPLPQSPQLVVRPWEELAGGREGFRVLVTCRDNCPAGPKDLLLRPRMVTVGVGCKRGVGADGIMDEIKSALQEAGISLLCVKAMGTITARASEEGMVEAAKKLKIELWGFSPEQLNTAIDLHGLAKSPKVMERMGVGGVCEPAAILACRKGRLLAPKRKGAGITVALAGEESGWWE